MKLLINALTALLLTVSLVTAADEGKKPEAKGDKPKWNPEEVFAKLDKDGDKSLSLDEFKASPRFKKDASKAEAVFKAKDKDADSKLSLDEFKAHTPKPDGEHHRKDGEGHKKDGEKKDN